MKKRYEVVTTVWRLADYELKKGDIVEIDGWGEGWVAISNVYFKEYVCVSHQDLYIHCRNIN